MFSIGLVLVAGLTAAWQGPPPTDPEPRLQARTAGQGSPVVLLGGGLLGADGWGGVPEALAATICPCSSSRARRPLPFHRAMNEALQRLLPRAEPLDLPAGHNAPTAAPGSFADAWRAFRQRADGLAGAR